MTEFIRLYTIVVAVISMVGSVMVSLRAHRSRRNEQGLPITFGYMLTRAGVVVVLASIIYGVTEGELRSLPVFPRSYVLAGGLTWLAFGVIALIREGKPKHPKPPKETP